MNSDSDSDSDSSPSLLPGVACFVYITIVTLLISALPRSCETKVQYS